MARQQLITKAMPAARDPMTRCDAFAAAVRAASPATAAALGVGDAASASELFRACASARLDQHLRDVRLAGAPDFAAGSPFRAAFAAGPADDAFDHVSIGAVRQLRSAYAGGPAFQQAAAVAGSDGGVLPVLVALGALDEALLRHSRGKGGAAAVWDVAVAVGLPPDAVPRPATAATANDAIDYAVTVAFPLPGMPDYLAALVPAADQWAL
jgi:hypothetical protein